MDPALQRDDVGGGLRSAHDTGIAATRGTVGDALLLLLGGCDIVREMLEAGELTAMFDEKGVAYDKSKLLA